MAKKTALITGITGQDGTYLARLLVNKGYTVHGLRRFTSYPNTARLDAAFEHESVANHKNIHLHYGDMTDGGNLTRIIANIKPDEIYNLAAQSHVHVSFDAPEYTANTDALGTLRIMESLRTLKLQDTTRFVQASSSELFGKVHTSPQNETTPFYPRSPYAAAKLYAYWITVNYREAYGIFAANSIMFNHESPLRGDEFVTQKIVKSALRIAKGSSEKLALGNLDAMRDWGHAADYVEGMWRILQAQKPDDFVLATGVSTSVRQFAEMAFSALNIKITWQGSGRNEIGIRTDTGQTIIYVDPQYCRPAEVDSLIGDSTKARRELGWTPQHTLQSLLKDMLESAQEKNHDILDRNIA